MAGVWSRTGERAEDIDVLIAALRRARKEPHPIEALREPPHGPGKTPLSQD